LRVYGTFKPVILFLFFLFGIVIGSFLNVCISRIPEGLSIVRPGSRCPRCLTPIKAYDNVPIFGWLWLRGKCRTCGLSISAMYPIVELLTGLLFMLTYWTFGLGYYTPKYLIFGCLIIVLVVTDLNVRLLPDAINWPGFVIGVLFALKVPMYDAAGYTVLHALRLGKLPASILGVLDSLLGAAFGSFLLWGVAALYRVVRKRDGMGMGDVKMMAMVGAFLGVYGTFLTIFIGTLLGSIVGVSTVLVLYLVHWKHLVAVRASRRGLGSVGSLRWAIATQYQFPLGTFLGVAALIVVYVVPWIELYFYRS
jgi:leader peptidase (prepilin peptidase) / N-methyltransferase